jgi:hypothetical protein
MRIAIFSSQLQWLKVMQRLCQRLTIGEHRKGLKKRGVVAFVNDDAIACNTGKSYDERHNAARFKGNRDFPVFGFVTPVSPMRWCRGEHWLRSKHWLSGMVFGRVCNRPLASTLQA